MGGGGGGGGLATWLNSTAGGKQWLAVALKGMGEGGGWCEGL